MQPIPDSSKNLRTRNTELVAVAQTLQGAFFSFHSSYPGYQSLKIKMKGKLVKRNEKRKNNFLSFFIFSYHLFLGSGNQGTLFRANCRVCTQASVLCSDEKSLKQRLLYKRSLKLNLLSSWRAISGFSLEFIVFLIFVSSLDTSPRTSFHNI